LLARLLGWPEAEAELIRHASPMHDIGKVAIPDAILLKPGALDPAERKLMERHAEIGYEILSGSEAPLNVLAATIALTHHERIDGTGYPRGLSGEEIPIAGRIVAVADVFDALVSRRPYRPALSIAEATAIMRDARGDHVDAAILDVFLGNLDQVEAIRQAHLDPTGDRRAPEPTGSRLE
jgi:putative two-component system response regulator